MEFYCRKMEFSFGLPAQKEGNVTDVKKPERKNEEIPKVSPYFRNHYGNNGVSDLNSIFGKTKLYYHLHTSPGMCRPVTINDRRRDTLLFYLAARIQV